MPVPLYARIILWIAYLVSLYFAVFWFLVLLEVRSSSKPRLQRYLSVTIAVPAYNESDNIVQCLESLTELSYPRGNIEIIVINDGSTDDTGNVVRSFIQEKGIVDIRLVDKVNGGKGAALNNALHIARGELFVCLDADSVVRSDALKKIVPYFNDAGVAVVLPCLKVYKPRSLLERIQGVEYIVNMFYKSLMGRLDCIHVAPGPFSVYRKDILVEVGGFDERNLTEDLEISLRLQSRHYRIVQMLDAEVFTIVPKNIGELYMQRNRWYKGALINAVKYRHIVFNRTYGDFGFMQMPTIFVSGIVAVILVVSMLYFGLKPYVDAFVNFFFVDFDFYTLIKTFQLNLSLLDFNYSELLAAIVMVVITGYVLRSAHKTLKERFGSQGIVPSVSYMFLYFIVIGLVWIVLVFDLIFRRQQKW